jgi:hypothetical protein
VEVLRLTAADACLLAARFAEHGNSQRRMAAALEEAGARETVRRLRALRSLERTFGIDLGNVCFRFRRRHDPRMHPIERSVVEYVTRVGRAGPDAEEEIWVLVDHVRRIRELMEGRLVAEPGT